MTTQTAANLYLAQHLLDLEGREIAVYNPKKLPLDALPTIFGFNNGGFDSWYSGVLLAEDGECLGSHVCSHESYMPYDLGILAETRPDRHATFQEKYPDGYKMQFVPASEALTHFGLKRAYAKNQERAKKTVP